MGSHFKSSTSEIAQNRQLAAIPKALIIEDLPAHALTAAAILRQHGFHCELASSLTEGVDYAEQMFGGDFTSVYPPVILVDLHLPVQELQTSAEAMAMTEGAAIAAYLTPRLPHDTVLIAFTSDPSTETHQEALLAGC